MEIFEKAVAALLICIMLFIVPLVITSQREDQLIQNDVENTVSTFVDDVCKVGYVSQDMYNKFLLNLDSTQQLYDISIVHKHDVVYPVFDRNNDVVSTKTTQEAYYEDDIMDAVFNDTSAGIYTMGKDDTFSVTVSSRKKSFGTKIRELVYSTEISGGKIYYSYGNLIRNEKW